MPSFKFPVSMPDGGVYVVQRLLAKGKSNAKTAKSDKSGTDYITHSLSLSPAHTSGFNLCSSASLGCVASCIFTSGLASFHPRQILPARIAKARMYRLHKEQFLNRLRHELGAALRRATQLGARLCVRLNVFSDVFWERETSLIKEFPNIQFYDYTKHHKRMLRYLSNELPANYHLTFSWSGTNKDKCIEVLFRGGNVAVPFRVKYHRENRKPLPPMFLGRPIIDGDITDLRFLDKTAEGGIIVGLRAKGQGKKDATGFVVEPYDLGTEQ